MLYVQVRRSVRPTVTARNVHFHVTSCTRCLSRGTIQCYCNYVSRSDAYRWVAHREAFCVVWMTRWKENVRWCTNLMHQPSAEIIREFNSSSRNLIIHLNHTSVCHDTRGPRRKCLASLSTKVTLGLTNTLLFQIDNRLFHLGVFVPTASRSSHDLQAYIVKLEVSHIPHVYNRLRCVCVHALILLA